MSNWENKDEDVFGDSNDVFENRNNVAEDRNEVDEEYGGSEEIERNSYSKWGYKSIENIRAKGAEYGVKVPLLKHELTKSSFSLGLKIFTVFSGILIVAGLAALIWASIALVMPVIKSIRDSATEADDVLTNLPILGTLTGISTLLLWAITIAIPFLGLTAAVGCVAFLWNIIRVGQSSVEEKAHGHVLSRLKTGALIFAIIFVVFAIVGIALLKTPIIAVIGFLVAAYAFGLYVVLQMERSKARSEFDTFPEDVKSDYIEYSKKVELASSRHAAKKLSKQMTWRSFGKLAPLFALLEGFIDARQVYRNLKGNKRYRDKAVGLAKRSLQQMLIFAVMAFVALFFGYWGISFKSLILRIVFDNQFMRVLMLIVAVGFAIYAFILCFPLALNLAIKQLLLNRKPLGWVALAVCLGVVIAFVAVAVVLFGKVL